MDVISMLLGGGVLDIIFLIGYLFCLDIFFLNNVDIFEISMKWLVLVSCF